MRKNIWIINHYAELPYNGVMLRHYYFAKHLTNKGYDVKVFTSSAVHNSNFNMIKDKNVKYRVEEINGFRYIHIRTDNYTGNKWRRVKNILQFYFGIMNNYKKISKDEIPDIIYASSLHPLALLVGYKLSKVYKCKYIVEIRDLWPESIFIKRPNFNSLFLKLFYYIEKEFYKKSDELIFTFEGGKDYIIEKGWDKKIDLSKIHYINNGIDFETYTNFKNQYTIKDLDLLDTKTIKIVFTGSIREIYNIPFLIETAKLLKSRQINNVRILIYGRGPLLDKYVEECKKENLDNIIFKGFVNKKYIPYILSMSDCNLLHGMSIKLKKYGHSNNKSFEYYASGKPVISTIDFNYDPIIKYNCGMVIKQYTPQSLFEAIYDFINKSKDDIEKYCKASLEAAKEFDFMRLTEKLITVIEHNNGGNI